MAKQNAKATAWAMTATASLDQAGYAIDPTVLIQLILQVIQSLMGGCGKTAAQTLAACQEPSRLEEIVMHAKMRALGIAPQHREAVQAALSDEADTRTAEDIQEIYNETK